MRIKARLASLKPKAKLLTPASAAPETARCQDVQFIGTRKQGHYFTVSKACHSAYRNPVSVRNLRPNSFSHTMKKTLFPGLLAAALLAFTLPSCGPSPVDTDEDIVTSKLPPLPAAPDTTAGAKQPEAYRELNAVNATEDIKKMQPQM